MFGTATKATPATRDDLSFRIEEQDWSTLFVTTAVALLAQQRQPSLQTSVSEAIRAAALFVESLKEVQENQ